MCKFTPAMMNCIGPLINHCYYPVERIKIKSQSVLWGASHFHICFGFLESTVINFFNFPQ